MNVRALLALAAVLVVAACETTPTPYQPLVAPGSGAEASGGFSEQPIDATHVRISFKGNSLTSRERVETYLLYRAAEVTAKQGFDWFEMVDRHTRDNGATFVHSDGPWGAYWTPYWRYRSFRGWGSWDPYWGDPFFGGYDIDRIDEYQATAEIGMGHGPKPSDAKTFDAHQVMANLGPKIVRPK